MLSACVASSALERGAPSSSVEELNAKMATTVLNVPDISCEHCERTIINALTPVEGIHSVSVDIPQKQVRVDYDEAQVDVERMKDVLQEEDYPVESASPS